jgi:hypothetical protein
MTAGELLGDFLFERASFCPNFSEPCRNNHGRLYSDVDALADHVGHCCSRGYDDREIDRLGDFVDCGIRRTT